MENKENILATPTDVQKDYIQNGLPAELWTKIFEYLDQNTIQKRATLVSTRWFHIIRDNPLLSGDLILNASSVATKRSKLEALLNSWPKVNSLTIKYELRHGYDELSSIIANDIQSLSDFKKYGIAPFLKSVCFEIILNGTILKCKLNLDHPQHHGTIFVTCHKNRFDSIFDLLNNILEKWTKLVSLEIVFDASGFRKSDNADIFEDKGLFRVWRHYCLADPMMQDMMCCKNIREFKEKFPTISRELKQLSIRAIVKNKDYWVPLSKHASCRKVTFSINENSKEVPDLYINDYQSLNTFLEDLDRMALNGKNVVVHVFLQNSLAQKVMSGEMARLTRAMNDFFRCHNESITQFGISYDGNSGMNILEDIKPMILKKMPNVKVFNYEKHFPPCFHPLYQCGAPDCDNPEGFISRQEREEHWESNLECAMAQFF